MINFMTDNSNFVENREKPLSFYNMKIKTIDESEFCKLEGSRQVISHEFARKFAVVDLDNPLGCYGISWRSDLVEPSITLSHSGITIWIGVDQ